MSEHVKYSVIIPVYNREKTVARCLDTLTDHDRTDVQLILVDDGSKDASAGVIRAYQQKYPYIQYIYQENAGVSAARNTGLRHAKGAYITFVDSDDYVAAGYFDRLDQADDQDLVAFAYAYTGDNTIDQRPLYQQLAQLTDVQEKRKSLLASRKIMYPCNKCFKRSIIEDYSLEFIEGMHIGEDFNFCLAYTMHCRDIGILCEKLVFVDISDGTSLSRKYRPRLDQMMHEVFRQAAQTIRQAPLTAEHRQELLCVADYLFAKNACTGLAEEFKVKNLSWFKDQKQIREICDTFRQPLTQGYVSVVHRVLRLLLKWRLDLPVYLVTWLAKGRHYQKKVKDRS